MHPRNPGNAQRFPLDKADLCVKCGLCLPHCPTYLLGREEGESPRGRIALMQGLASGALEPGKRLAQHLEQCLGCRACETVCPAKVPYGELIDSGREELVRRGRRPVILARIMARGLSSPRLTRLSAGALRWYQRLGLQRLVRRQNWFTNGWLGRAEALLPPIEPAPRWRGSYAAAGKARGRVALFRGCVSSMLDPRTLLDTVAVLTRCGFEVAVPAAQTCCGALYQHSGLTNQAQRLYRRNAAAFAGEFDAILVPASGCAATLADYQHLAPGDEAARLARRIRDPLAFVEAQSALQNLALQPQPARVLVHDPCTLKHALECSDSVYAGLARIPRLQCHPMPGNSRCCGAGGANVLTQPEIGAALVAEKVRATLQAGVDAVATSNIGCALHLAGALRRQGSQIEVVHPVTLLARALAPV